MGLSLSSAARLRLRHRRRWWQRHTTITTTVIITTIATTDRQGQNQLGTALMPADGAR
ncbi:MAG TPA: hypothetical protein VGG56_04720 [Terracidiphilus sp.]